MFTVAFDFGIIHSQNETGGMFGPPVQGVCEIINRIRDNGIRVAIVSNQCETLEGIAAVEDYLEEYGIIVDDVQAIIPHCVCFVSDRAVRFTGNAENLLSEIGKMVY